MGLDIFILPAIVAVVLGIAPAPIKQCAGQLRGDGLAVVGLITGCIGLAFDMLAICAGIVWIIFLIAVVGSHPHEALENFPALHALFLVWFLLIAWFLFNTNMRILHFRALLSGYLGLTFAKPEIIP